MWRCLKYPAALQEFLTNQAGKRTKVSKCALCITSLNLVLEAFASQNQRNMPHWTARGPSMDSWQGWVWSYGNGLGAESFFCFPSLTLCMGALQAP